MSAICSNIQIALKEYLFVVYSKMFGQLQPVDLTLVIIFKKNSNVLYKSYLTAQTSITSF